MIILLVLFQPICKIILATNHGYCYILFRNINDVGCISYYVSGIMVVVLTLLKYMLLYIMYGV